MSLAAALLLLVLSIPLVLMVLRANELFFLRIRGGKVRVTRGRIPQKLLNDLCDILRDGHETMRFEGTLRGVVEDRRVRLYAEEGELTDAQRQRLRNVVSMWSPAQIRNAPPRR